MFDTKIDANGEAKLYPNIKRQLLVATVAKHGDSFINELAKHFIAIGGKKVIDPIDNAKPIELSKSSPTELRPASAAEAMAKGGRLV